MESEPDYALTITAEKGPQGRGWALSSPSCVSGGNIVLPGDRALSDSPKKLAYLRFSVDKSMRNRFRIFKNPSLWFRAISGLFP